MEMRQTLTKEQLATINCELAMLTAFLAMASVCRKEVLDAKAS